MVLPLQRYLDKVVNTLLFLWNKCPYSTIMTIFKTINNMLDMFGWAIVFHTLS